ncbi:MAG: hypothetical protein A07HR60_02826 [uncultured archaeon A07HR60]|nr:MAG: hypothetical protein A07HR60_02826 [uncultured archaeon A07HR60]
MIDSHCIVIASLDLLTTGFLKCDQCEYKLAHLCWVCSGDGVRLSQPPFWLMTPTEHQQWLEYTPSNT